MPIKTIFVDPPGASKAKPNRKPSTTTWNGYDSRGKLSPAVMLRNHSINNVIDEILTVSKRNDVVKIGIVGDQDTGKTELMKLIGHLVHKKAEIPFAVRILTKEKLLDFAHTWKDLPPTNYFIGFDDVSFLKAHATAKQIEEVKSAVSEIRHLSENQHVKIVLAYDYHYILGLDKWLRQTHFKFHTTVGSSDTKNLLDIVSGKYEPKIMKFKSINHDMQRTGTFSYNLRGGGKFTYQYRDPFIPLLFWNDKKLRHVVSPLRTWIDPICQTCDMAEGNHTSEIPVPEFVKECNTKFGAGIVRVGIKLLMFQNGVNTYSPNITQFLRAFARRSKETRISVEQVAEELGLSVTRTSVFRQLDGVVANVKEEDLNSVPESPPQ